MSASEVGRGFALGLGVLAAPFHKQTVGQARENPMHPDGVAVAQPAFIVAPGDVEPRVLPVLDAPVLPVEHQPVVRVQLLGRPTGQEHYGFGGAALHLAPQLRGLGGERKASLLGREGNGAEGPRLGAAPVALDGAGQPRRIFRGERPPARWRPVVRDWPAPWAGCL